MLTQIQTNDTVTLLY